MKKIILTLLAVMACTLSFAETVKINGLYYSLGTTTATLVKDQSSDLSTYKAYTSVDVPASVTYNNYTYPVVTIGTSAFENCSNLQSVTLPNSITAIYTDAFYGCSKLGDINLPEGLTTINSRAFEYCNLDTIIIPSTVTSIGNKAFYNNPLKSITWLPSGSPISTGTGEDSPFYNSNGSKVTSFTFGPNVKIVPAYICYKMSRLDTIVLGHHRAAAFGFFAGSICLLLLHEPQVHQPAGDAENPAYQFLRGLYLARVHRTAGYLDHHQYGRFLRLYQTGECHPA